MKYGLKLKMVASSSGVAFWPTGRLVSDDRGEVVKQCCEQMLETLYSIDVFFGIAFLKVLDFISCCFKPYQIIVFT